MSLDAENTGLFARMVQGHLAGGGIALMATHIDLGLEAEVLDLTPCRVTGAEAEATDIFLAEGV